LQEHLSKIDLNLSKAANKWERTFMLDSKLEAINSI
jgi:hypothetical protein